MTQLKSACDHPIEDYIWNDTLQKFQCLYVIVTYDKGTKVENECGVTLTDTKE